MFQRKTFLTCHPMERVISNSDFPKERPRRAGTDTGSHNKNQAVAKMQISGNIAAALVQAKSVSEKSNLGGWTAYVPARLTSWRDAKLLVSN
jgi:hypothetical protein